VDPKSDPDPIFLLVLNPDPTPDPT
jgi:hypothetical protein